MGLLTQSDGGIILSLIRKLAAAGGIMVVLVLVIGIPGPVKGLKTDLSSLPFDSSSLHLDQILKEAKALDPIQLQRLAKKDWQGMGESAVRRLSRMQNGNLVKYFSNDLKLEQLVHSILLSSPSQVGEMLGKAGFDSSAVDSVCPQNSNYLAIAGELLKGAKSEKSAQHSSRSEKSALRALATGCVLRYVDRPGGQNGPLG